MTASADVNIENNACSSVGGSQGIVPLRALWCEEDVEMAEHSRKLVHHKCGYPLLVEVLSRFPDSVVVNYRECETPFIVHMCPRCFGALQLWWPICDEPTMNERGKMLDQMIDEMNVVLEAGDWSQVVALAPALRDEYLRVGDTLHAELISDLYSIACDALQHPLEQITEMVMG